MQDVSVFELLGIKSGDAITVDNSWSDNGPREVVPLGRIMVQERLFLLRFQEMESQFEQLTVVMVIFDM